MEHLAIPNAKRKGGLYAHVTYQSCSQIKARPPYSTSSSQLNILSILRKYLSVESNHCRSHMSSLEHLTISNQKRVLQTSITYSILLSILNSLNPRLSRKCSGTCGRGCSIPIISVPGVPGVVGVVEEGMEGGGRLRVLFFPFRNRAAPSC